MAQIIDFALAKKRLQRPDTEDVAYWLSEYERHFPQTAKHFKTAAEIYLTSQRILCFVFQEQDRSLVETFHTLAPYIGADFHLISKGIIMGIGIGLVPGTPTPKAS